MRRTHLHAAVLVLIAVIIGIVVLRQRLIAPSDGHGSGTRPAAARNFVLVTIDTLRADHVGAYGYAAKTTPSLDRIARSGVRFDRAYAPAPITLTSHASMLTGRYPPGHGARDNGMRVTAGIPTMATVLREQGFQTAAFIAAFPLDRRFGLSPGFDLYSDRMPRGPGGKLLNERPGREVVDEALAWLERRSPNAPFFVWVHLFEPHAPYGEPANAAGRTAIERYDEEIRTADAQVGRLLDGLGHALADTLVVAVGDHGEAFGEHGEITHSLFVYDTTLRVPWVMMGPGVAATAAAITDPVCLIDMAPTVLALLGKGKIDSDGVDLRPLLAGGHLPPRDLYAESFAPLFDFGWSPLRSVRRGQWKAIAAPRPELYDVDHDAGEAHDVAAEHADVAQRLVEQAGKYSPAEIGSQAATLAAGDRDTAARLRALGYLQGGASTGLTPGSGIGGRGGRGGRGAVSRADPKDRRELAARMGLVVSGELHGAELKATLEAILRDDPRNPQAHLRLGDCLLDEGQFAAAAPHFSATIAADLPSVDGYVGLAACQATAGNGSGAERTLRQALEREPGNPVVAANLGILEAKTGRLEAAVQSFRHALEADPDMHEARFNLAIAYADAGRRQDAEREALELLARLPASAPQRPEVERLLAALRR
jgi:arylsulfatase A-like enzyme/Flp pilus assembly protein TadD